MTVNYGERFRRFRRGYGYSQAELADLLGISQPLVSNYENGKVTPPNVILEKMEGLSSELSKDETKFGEWLRNQRNGRGLTQQELARMAGVSQIAISFIETGKTQSPQKSTIAAIEKALGRLPETIKSEIKKESKVSDLGEYLGPFPIGDWESNVEEDTPGIYVLYDSLKRPVRIGETGDIKRRLSEYKRDAWFFRTPTVETFAFIIVKEEKFRRQLEDAMIKLVGNNAMFNIQGRI